MNKKENALRILKFQNPEYVMSSMPVHYLCYTGCNHEGFDGIGDNSPVGSRWTDIWGIGWDKKQAGIMGYPVHHPLSDVEMLDSFQWVDPDDPRICKQIYDMASRRTDYDNFLCGSHRNLVLEKAEKLIGMDNLLMYFYTEPEFLREVFHKYMDFQLGIARHYISLGVEMISCSEDLGSQTSLLISPNMLRDFLIPEYKRLFSLYKKHGVIVEFHSCGHIEPIIEPLIDLGIDILNPIQATANDLDKIRCMTAGRIALHGGVRSDTILDGPIERIVDETRYRLWQLGRDGGYFCDMDQYMYFPKSHLDAVYDTVRNFGRYPIAEYTSQY